MREVFKPAATPYDPGSVFYTLTSDDVGKSTAIVTTAGSIPVGEVLGRVLLPDVGRRLYRMPARDGEWFWQAEKYRQRDERLAREGSSA